MNEPATIVSAFYIMNSKFPSAQYMRWIETFLANIPCHLVFFTDQDLIPMFEQMRGPHNNKTRFIALPREQWTAYTRYGKPFWQLQNIYDREKAIHSPDLYAIWYEKMEFVRRAIDLNPFGHNAYIWCDAGAFRYPEWLPRLQTFGSSASVIPEGKITLLQVEPFVQEDYTSFAVDTIGQFDDRNRIGGGIQAGTVDAWRKWIPLYNAKLEQRVAKEMFVGKDQTILAALVLENPTLVHRIQADRTLRDHWFTLLHTFSPQATKAPYFSILIPLYNGIELLSETLESIQKQTFQDYEVLIGVNGWPANSHVYQKAKQLASSKTRVFDMPECEGKAATLNALKQNAKAKWIALCDADDVWMENKLEYQHTCIEEFSQFQVFGTLCEYFGDLTGTPDVPIGDLSEEDFFKVNPLLHSSVVLRKELAQWNPDNRILEDYELWLRLRYQKKAKILNIPYILMRHRIHTASYFNHQNAQAVPELKNRIRRELNLPPE